MSANFQYDVFLSHSSKDKAVVRALAERLRGDGVSVWLDDWVLQPGSNIPHEIERGMENSRVLVLCMSENALGSDWSQLESSTFRFRDPLNTQRRFIPLRLDDVQVTGSLAQFRYINWLPDHRDEDYTKLLNVCRPSVEQPAGGVRPDLSSTGIRKGGEVKGSLTSLPFGVPSASTDNFATFSPQQIQELSETVAQLREKLQPRKVTPEQRERLVTSLSAIVQVSNGVSAFMGITPTVDVSAPPNDVEAQQYRDQIGNAFEEAGWLTAVFTSVGAMDVSGVALAYYAGPRVYPYSEPTPTEEVKAVQTALAKAGIPTSISVLSEYGPANIRFHVFVGQKPTL